MHNVDLKRCPFCGGKGKFRRSETEQFTVECDNVNCEATTAEFTAQRLAALAWNKRVPVPSGGK